MIRIDNIDISKFGAFLIRGGDNDLLTYPGRKEPPRNDWHEHDGVDADLSEVFFKEKKASLPFYLAAANGEEFLGNLYSLYALISAPGIRELYSSDFDKIFYLRYLSAAELAERGGLYKTGRKSATLTVEFAMDNPLSIFSGSDNLTPRNGRNSPSYVKVNDIDLSAFGIIVNQCYNTAIRLPPAKSSLTRSIDIVNGLIVYPPATTTYQAQQVAIECTMTADNRDDFYYNYEALFNNLKIPESVRLTTFAYDGESCYYSAARNFRKLAPFGRKVLVSFDIELILTNYRPRMMNLLITEDRQYYITTEDGYRIRM